MKKFLLAILILFVSEQAFSQTITLGSLSSTNYCVGGSISVPFTSTLPAGTSFTVTLRKGTTVFNTTGSTTSPINIFIPYNSSFGYGIDYNVQVTSGSTASLISPNFTVGTITNAEITDVNNHYIYTSSQDVLCTGKTKIYYATVKDFNGIIVTSNINYQWKKDGVDISGATSSSLAVSVSGTYTFVATQAGCSVSSYGVTLSVGTSAFPQLIVYGEDVSCTGTTKTIESSYYSNTATYQWQKDGANISGATSRAYNAVSSGIYRITVIDGTCNSTSSDRRLTFGTGLIASISAGNGDSTLCGSGSTKSLYAIYYPINPTQYTYQWQKDGVNISGATSSGYSATQAGVYTVTYSQGNCSSNSRGITIVSSTTAQKPLITSGNISSVCSGNIILNQNNNGVYSYIPGAWFKDGVVTTSTNTSTYNATLSGTYKLVNGYGTSCANESNSITVSIGTTFTPKIYIPSFYGSSNNLCGTSDYKYIYFDNQNLSSGTYTYQWIKDGVDIVGVTSSSTYVNSSGTGTYTLRVTNGACTVVSNAIVITNNTPTTTISTSDNNISCINKMVRLDLKGGATSYYTPVTWQRNGVTIVGETSGTLYTNQGGNYTATYNQNGCAGTSSTLALNVVQPPLMSIMPVTINNGQTATLTATGCAGMVTWYDALNGGSLLTTGNSYTSPPLPAATIFYANCVESTCSSIKRTAGVVNVNQLQTITLDNPSPTNICPESPFSVGFTTTGTFNGGNTFQVQLSDLSGNFSLTPTVLATGSSSPIVVNLDVNTPTSANYKIRILATDPLTASSPSNFISINNTPTITSNGIVTCSTILLQTPNLSGRTYQWQRDGINISGATGTSFSTSSSGIYTIISTVGTCVKTSNAIQIYSYNSFPSVSVTGSTTFCNGSSLVVSANPNNTVSTYQWRKDGVDIIGATSATYPATSTGSYSVRVTQGSCGTLTSSSVYLTTVSGANSLDNYTSIFGGTDISPNYNVYFQPFNICSGSMILSSSQRSAGTTYQWQMDGVDISGETNPTYTASQTGYYSVKIVQGACTGINTPVALRVGSLTPPSLGGDVNICTGSSHFINNSSNAGQNCCGTGLSYQWSRDGVDIPSATSAFSFATNTAGSYTLRVNQGACTSTSAPMRLTLGSTITSPTINANSVNDITACTGNTYQLSSSNNISSLTYQWIKDGVDIPSATSNFYNTSISGKYQVKITQGTCTATSTEVQQIFGDLTNVYMYGSNRFCGAGTVNLGVSPTCGDYTYQWKRNGIAISGANLSTYSTNVPAVYVVEITKGAKTFTTSTISVYEDCTVVPTSTSISTPYVYSNSSDRMICSGSGKQLIYCDNYSFQYPTVTYQWYKDGVQMAGQTSRFLFATDAGNYQIQLIVGTVQSSLSSTYTLYSSGNYTTINSVNGAFGCTEVLLNSSIPTSTSKLPYTYQWKKDGVNLSGANSNFYTANLSGSYSLETTLGTCAFTSPSLNVTIGNSNTSILSSTPSPNSICDNGYVSLSTLLSSSFVHQWYKDNILIPNINTRTYVATTAGSYSFTATRGACTYNSTAAFVINPSYSGSPYVSIGWIGGYESSSNLNLSACSGSGTTLLVNNYQQGKQYQWKNGSTIIAGATTSTYQPTASGVYSAEVTTVGGCVASSPTLTLNLGTTPSGYYINSNIVATNLCSGFSTNLNAGYGNFNSYQWYKDDVLIPNATSTIYNTNLEGSYNIRMTQGTCSVSTGYVVIQTSPTTLTPRITSVSTSSDVSCNLISGFLSTSSSLIGATFQWQRNGVNILGETRYYFYPNQNGTYQVIVNQGTCSGTSNAVEIQNGLGLVINTDGLTGFICGESGGTLRATSNGGTYQWKKDGVNIGSNSTALSVNAIGSYTVTNTRSGCSATSNPFVISSIPAMETLKTGIWNNIGIWNCLRTPNVSDNVKVNFGHIVSLPNTSTYFIKSINDIGSVNFGTGSNLRIGF
jgi:large repetitive protein